MTYPHMQEPFLRSPLLRRFIAYFYDRGLFPLEFTFNLQPLHNEPIMYLGSVREITRAFGNCVFSIIHSRQNLMK